MGFAHALPAGHACRHPPLLRSIAIACGEGLSMPTLHFRFRPNPTDEGGVVSFHVDKEGAFLWVWPFELALLWPGVQS
jgi:hypothetical protein